MADLSKYTKLLEKLKGVNHPAQKLIAKGAAEEQRFAQQMAKLAKEAELAKVGTSAEPLTHNPFGEIDVSKFPDKNSGFQLVGGPQDKGFILGEASDISRPPVPYKAPVIEPEMHLPALTEQPKPFNGKTIDITDDALNAKMANVDMPGPESLKSKWGKYQELAANNKGKIAAGLGAGAMLSLGSLKPEDQMRQGSTTESTADQPIAKEIKEPESEEEKELGRQMAKISANLGKPDAEVKSSVVDFGDGDSEANAANLRSAQDRASLLGGFANIRDSHAGMAYALAGLDKPSDLKGGANMRKQAEGIVPQFQERVKFEKEDPNSPQSKGYRELAKSMGFEIKGNASAADLEKLFPQLSNIYTQREGNAARKDMMRDRLEVMRTQMATMKDAKAGARDLKDRTFLQGLRKEATGGAYGKMFNNYNTAKRMQTSLGQFAHNPSGYSDYATLMGGLKALQGDESVVKEAEIRLGMGATSAVNKVMNYVQHAANGKSLQPSQREEMVRVINILSETAKNQYVQAVEPLILQAKQEGYDPKFILGEELRTTGAAPSGGPVGASGLDPAARQKRIQELKAKQGIK